MASKNVNPALKNLQDIWKDSEANTGYFVADGVYNAKIIGIVIGESKNKKVLVTVTYTIIGSNFDGKKTASFYSLESPIGVSLFKGLMEILDIAIPEDIMQLPLAIQAFMEKFKGYVSISVKNKDERSNVSLLSITE